MKQFSLYKVSRLIVIVSIMTTTSLLPVKLERKIHNKTDRPVWVGMYHYYDNQADRKVKPVKIEPGTSKAIKTRGRSLKKWRVMVFEFDLKKLKRRLTKSEYDGLPNKRVGTTGSYFIYMSRKTGELTGSHYLEWKTREVVKIVKPVVRKIAESIKEELRPVKDNPYKDTQAQVRVGNQLPQAEKDYLAKRRPIVKKALEKFTGRNLDDKYVPNIAFLGSGGGYRAMLYFTGLLTGADKIGLLNAVTYISALSGSSWALAAWFTLGQPIQEFRNNLVKKVTKDIKKFSKEDLVPIIEILLTKLAYSQHIGLVDLYGALLSNTLFPELGSNRQMVYLYQQAERIKNGDWPFPIYTAVDARKEVYEDPPWYEFSPHEVGTSKYGGVYVSPWAWGRRFENGKSVNFAPPQTLGFYLGTFGSAFGVHVQVAWKEMAENIKNPVIRSIIDVIVQEQIEPIAGERFAWAEVSNFMKGMPRQPLSGLNRQEYVDAGTAFNLPYPPVSGERPERKPDILFFLDASAGKIGKQLKKTEAYARRKGLKFPAIDYTNIGKKAVSIFKNEDDPSVPVVIYMPCINDVELWKKNKDKPEYRAYRVIEGFDVKTCIKESFCNTMNFKFREEQSEQLMLLTEFNVVASEDKVVEAINWVIDQRSK